MVSFERIWRRLGGTTLLHGRCPDPSRGGVSTDMELDRWAEGRGIPRDRFPADWKKHGRAAGPIRNREMVKTADVLVAFTGGDGTADCRRAAEALGLPVYVVTPSGKVIPPTKELFTAPR